MFRTVLPSIEALFAGPKKTPGTPLDFEWRLVRRKRRPFLLLPDTAADARVSLALYSAQRRRAKIWRALFPLLFRTPAAFLFDRVRLRADTSSEMIQFLAQQSGVPVEELSAPPIKFGGVAAHKSRLALLLCDETKRPLKVVKVGLNATGRAATKREADLLERLPPNTIGCIRLTGRLATMELAAFATEYFPGESPADDAGLEILFHAWLNPASPVPLESLDSWCELEAVAAVNHPAAWSVLRAAVAGKNIHSTLHHGDFAPWNIRAINSNNLQAFDWERGHLHGIPGWDWFHFIIQTAILARRHSVERAAAEVEQLIQSPRFEKYAAAAGISEIVRPLVLGYLLHHQWVVRPLEGARTTAQLFDLLAARWGLRPVAQTAAISPKTSPEPGLRAGAVQQLKSAAAQLGNAFWEPSLNSKVQPTLATQFAAHWPALLLCSLLLAAVTVVHYKSGSHLLFLLFYLVPCVVLTLKTERRWGVLLATVAAVIGPVMMFVKDSGFHRLDVTLWNIVMRFIILQMCVLFVDHLHRHKYLFRRPVTPARPPATFVENWAVVLASGLLLVIVAALDYFTTPQMIFLPLYLLPCMVLTLVLNLRWGIPTALAAMATASLVEYRTNPTYHLAEIFGWNFIMRLAISLVIVLLLDRIHKENILFFSGNTEERPGAPSAR